MSLPAGSFVASAVLGGFYRDKATGKKHIGPSWIGIIRESREARQAQWEEIKACRADRRNVWTIEGPGQISKEARMLLETEKLPEESFYSLAAKLAEAGKNAAAKDCDSEVPF